MKEKYLKDDLSKMLAIKDIIKLIISLPLRQNNKLKEKEKDLQNHIS